MNSRIFLSKKAFIICKLSIIFYLSASTATAQSFVITKKRPSQINVESYKQIVVGDIVGPSGYQTEDALNLSDELSSKLFNSNAQEILDRNALEKIISSGSKLKVGDDKTVAVLKNKLNSAVLLTGRIQTKTINQEEVSNKNIVVVNGCYYSYQWKASSEIVVQIKVVDVSTGKMLYNGPIAKNSSFETKASCEHTPKIDPAGIATAMLKDVAAEIVKLLLPYQEEINVAFQAGTLLKNPFKKIDEAATHFKKGSFEDGLKILKTYTEDNSLKDKFKAQAYYNYGLGLFCVNQFEEAKAEIRKAIALNSGDTSYEQWYTLIDKEKNEVKKLTAKQ